MLVGEVEGGGWLLPHTLDKKARGIRSAYEAPKPRWPLLVSESLSSGARRHIFRYIYILITLPSGYQKIANALSPGQGLEVKVGSGVKSEYWVRAQISASKVRGPETAFLSHPKVPVGLLIGQSLGLSLL